MGIKPAALRIITQYMPAARVLSLSYPDLVMTQSEFEDIAGFRTEKVNQVGQWHGKREPLPDTAEAFSKLGVKEFRCVDIVASRGCEEIADLNIPQEFGAYDMVLDCGTTEHCANVWQATLNAAHAVKPDGIIFHTPPVSMTNHGFWCIQPTFYHDLYTQNGWQILQLLLTDGEEVREISPTSRMQITPELSLYVAARRVGNNPLKAPIQTKYLNNPTLS